jgi:hypothetical protein
MSKTVAIVQSNYIPWKGYFDLIARADEFILLDDVQYTRRDWRNRNRIKTARGLEWLTIPVEVKGKYQQAIRDTVVSDVSWPERHWRTISQHYARAPFFGAYRERFEELYRGTAERYLSEVNYRFLTAICAVLGIGTPLRWSSEYELANEKTDRLVSLCRQAAANIYLTGPAAKSYLNEARFHEHGIDVAYMDYSGYPDYDQLYPPFEHGVTVLDLILHTGPDAPQYLRPRRS